MGSQGAGPVNGVETGVVPWLGNPAAPGMERSMWRDGSCIKGQQAGLALSAVLRGPGAAGMATSP